MGEVLARLLLGFVGPGSGNLNSYLIYSRDYFPRALLLTFLYPFVFHARQDSIGLVYAQVPLLLWRYETICSSPGRFKPLGTATRIRRILECLQVRVFEMGGSQDLSVRRGKILVFYYFYSRLGSVHVRLGGEHFTSKLFS